MSISKISLDYTWTLFLDRDGVINKKIPADYVKKWDEFKFINNSLKGISILSEIFHKIIIVTNQRGVGRKLMTEDQLNVIHDQMIGKIVLAGGRIDEILYCPDTSEDSQDRKPNIGMGLKAKLKHPTIDFKKSIMIGDSNSDLEFGHKLGMKTFLISKHNNDLNKQVFKSLFEVSKYLRQINNI